MKVIWSPLAQISFDELILFLEKKWEAKVIIKLFNEIEVTLKVISENPYLFPVISDKKKIRKCLIRKKTLLFFQVNEKLQIIELILFVDGRKNPLKFKF